jgi:pyoverdine/dityrosine biosynthesis protein Dit1
MKMIDQIMTVLLEFRAECSTQSQCLTKNCPLCTRSLKAQLAPMLLAHQKITFILPGFAAKSANREKTLGPLPDLGERLALKRLHELCKKISEIYSPGAELIICADGHVFNDLVGVSEKDLKSYSDYLRQLLNGLEGTYLKCFDLTQAYPHLNSSEQRETLVQEFGQSLEQIRESVQNNSIEKELFNGIHRFVFEDQKVLHDFASLSQCRKYCKTIAYQVILRSHAWSALIAKRYPNCVRFSIHPYPCGAEKFGLQLLPSENRWATPWHNVVLEKNGQYQLMKHKEALALGAKVALEKGYPSHYVL